LMGETEEAGPLQGGCCSTRNEEASSDGQIQSSHQRLEIGKKETMRKITKLKEKSRILREKERRRERRQQEKRKRSSRKRKEKEVKDRPGWLARRASISFTFPLSAATRSCWFMAAIKLEKEHEVEISNDRMDCVTPITTARSRNSRGAKK